VELELTNKTYVITGATSGIGYAAAEILARRGAAFIGVGRDPQRCRQAEAALRRLGPGAPIDYLVADLSLQREVNALAERIAETLTARAVCALDGLVNNAGTFAYWYTLTPEGVEMQWAVNHLAPFLLTRRLLPLLAAAPLARVVTVSSDSHVGARIDWQDPQQRRRYNGLRAYGVTKLANVLFTLELNRRLGAGSPVRAFAADPGLVKTDIGLKGTPGLVQTVWKWRRSGGIPAIEAAEGVVFLLTEPGIQDASALYWKHSRPRRTSKEAQDAQSAARLWELSEHLCGMEVAA